MTVAAAGLALSAVSAVGQIQAGRAQARAYERQAEVAKLQAKRTEIQHKQQGVEVLRRLRQNLSTVNARAAAGGMDPYSGTPQGIKDYGTRLGTEEFYLTQENAALSLVTGEINAAQYRDAASQARRQGFYSAIGTMGTAFATYGAIGSAPSGVGGFAGGGSVGGAVSNTLYPTTGSLGMPSMVPGG